MWVQNQVGIHVITHATHHVPLRLDLQEAFMENYFASQRENIFRNVEVLIYVFDVESRDLEKDMHYYQVNGDALSWPNDEVHVRPVSSRAVSRPSYKTPRKRKCSA